jgi:hypothetical protein
LQIAEFGIIISLSSPFRKGGLGGFEALRKMTREEELKKEASFPPLP